MADQQTPIEVTTNPSTSPDTVVELQTAPNAETKEAQESTAQSEEKQNDNNVPASLQRAMLQSRPTVQDLFQKKVTWKEFLGVYNVLRIVIAAIFAVLIWLSNAGIAYLLNPNTCEIQRTNPDRIQYNPIANMAIISWQMILIFFAIIRIFGHEVLWSNKRINRVLFVTIAFLTITFMVYGFLLDISFARYILIASSIFTVASFSYVFVTNGFYMVWLTVPFAIVILMIFAIILAAKWIFNHGIGPESAWFGFTMSVMLSLLESVALKINAFSFPYKWGKRCTCPCNKNKFKSKLAKNYEEESVTIESELSDVFLFYYSMLFMSTFEAMRVTAYVLTKDEHFGFNGLISLILFSVILECISRNALSWEVLYRCILKKEAKDCPGRDRLYAIWYGTKFQGEYVPIWCILFMSLVNYGPFAHCGRVRDGVLADTVNISGDYWLFLVMFGAELLSDIFSEMVLKIGRYFKWFGVKNEEGEDPPRAKTLVKVNLIPHMWILVHSYTLATISFQWDAGNRK